MIPLDAFWLIRSEAGSSGSCEYKLAERRLFGEVALRGELKEAFEALDNLGNVGELRIGTKTFMASGLPLVGALSFDVSAPKGYFEDISELISRHPFSPPSDMRVFSIEDESLLEKYHDAANLAELLHQLADAKKPKSCTIFSRSSLEVLFDYTKDDLRKLDALDELAKLMSHQKTEDINATRLRDIYQSLFKQALYDVLSNIPRGSRFSHLLEHFSECVFRFRLSFRSFSDEANCAINRYEEKRAGMIAALNGILGTIQTSLIGIPLAGLLALREMKPESGWSFENITIFSAVFIVGALLLILSSSQGKSLRAIKLQYDDLSKEIDDCGGGKTKIGKSLALMGEHQSLIVRLLIFVRVIIILFMLIAGWAFFFR